MRISLVLVMATSATVLAAPDGFKVGDYTLDNDGSVVKNGAKLTLVADVTVDKATVDDKARRVVIETSGLCGGSTQFKFSFDQIEARFVNAAAVKQHLAKKYKESAAGFEKAAQLDAKWNIPAYNLASARNLLKDQAGALAALGPWIAAEPLQTYYQILADPELQSLATAKELVALKTAKPGTATHASKNYRYSVDRGLIAYGVARSQSWMACAVVTDLEVHEVKTGKRVANLPWITKADTAGLDCGMGGTLTKAGKAKLAERLAKHDPTIDKVLADFGFEVATYESATMPKEPDDAGKQKTSFSKSKLYAVVGKNGTNILRGNTVVGSVSGDQLDYIEAAKYMVGMSTNGNEGGCPNETYESGPIK